MDNIIPYLAASIYIYIYIHDAVKFCREWLSDTALLCAKQQNDWTTEIDGIGCGLAIKTIKHLNNF